MLRLKCHTIPHIVRHNGLVCCDGEIKDCIKVKKKLQIEVECFEEVSRN
jgi:hypothetical protein